MKYQVVDGHTKQIVNTYKSRVVARRKADKLDLVYGAIRYYVRGVEEL